MPFSQQPGPLISMGENLLDKHQYQLLLFADDYIGAKQHYADLYPGIVYGITDSLSILASTPYAISYRTNQYKSTGFEDAFIQMEYAYYTASTCRYADTATILGNVTLPTGSAKKNPITGYGSTSFLLGTTFNRTYVDWFVFDSFGGFFTTAKNGTKYGNNYLYQFGFGKDIATTKNWIFAWLVEIDGTYAQQDRVNGLMNPDSGGNVIYVTPSLWFSTKQLILQLGVGKAASQHLYGHQNRESYLLAAAISWTSG